MTKRINDYICSMFKNGRFVGFAKDKRQRFWLLVFTHEFWVGDITYVMHCTEVEFIETIISQHEFEFESKRLNFDFYHAEINEEEYNYEILNGAYEILDFDL